MFWRRKKTFSYTCTCCGEQMTGSPSFSMNRAPFVAGIADEELADRVYEDPDLCHIRNGTEEISDGDVFGIRVTLEVPIKGVAESFTWGVWVSQSRENFVSYVDAVGTDQTGRVTFGWMPMTLAFYRRTAADAVPDFLACDVHWQAAGTRPRIVLHECDHPLYVDQRDGIGWDRAVKMAQFQMALLHQAH